MLTLAGCHDMFDINTSPDNPVSVTCDVVLPSALFFTVQEAFDNAEYNIYLGQCLTTTGRSQTSTFSYKTGWGGFMDMNRHPQWRRHYYDIGVNTQYMIADAQKRGMRNYILIAQTLDLYSLLITTDEFGEMAMTQAYIANTPGYDDQKVIYDSIGRAFDKLLRLYDDPEWVNCPTNGTITAKGDRMYHGDLQKWRAFVKGLYARYLVRNLPNMNNTPEMCQKIINAVDDAFAAGFAANEPIYKFDGGAAEEQNCQWGPRMAHMNLGWPQARLNELTSAVPGEMMCALLGFYPRSLGLNARSYTPKLNSREAAVVTYALDPRAERMMEPRSDGTTKALRGLKNNIGMDVTYGTDYKAVYFPDLYCSTNKTNPYTRDDGYIALMTEEELLFIKAEAQYWLGQKGAAYTTTRQAVERSFQRYGVRGNIGKGYDADGNLDADIEDKLIDLFYAVRLPAEDFSIADLMQQKYVAMYLHAEQWTDVRRYNYSSPTNGIQYDGKYVYQVVRVHDETKVAITPDRFPETKTVSLRRPYNIYQPHWETSVDQGTNFMISANAWINRIQPDPETEDKYNSTELKRLGAYKNHDWLRKRMIWQMPTNPNGAITSYGDGEWMLQYSSIE